MVLPPYPQNCIVAVLHSLVEKPNDSISEASNEDVPIGLIGSYCCEIGSSLSRDILEYVSDSNR